MNLLASLDRIDRRVIYLFVLISLALPIISKWSLPPAEMESANMFYRSVEALRAEPGKIVMIAADWAPSTQAENGPQTEVAVEHLMRRRIPFAIVSLLPYAKPFLEEIPKSIAARLEKEYPGERWIYGKDWVNFGYLPNAAVAIQGIPKADHLSQFLPTDVNGTAFADIPCLKGVTTFKDITTLMEFTGSVGVLNIWLQLFQSDDHRPALLHGCTSVTIPEAHSFLSSKQLVGLFEGVAGAAWYEKLLGDSYPGRTAGKAIRMTTSLGVAHLIIIGMIILGNIGYLRRRRAQV